MPVSRMRTSWRQHRNDRALGAAITTIICLIVILVLCLLDFRSATYWVRLEVRGTDGEWHYIGNLGYFDSAWHLEGFFLGIGTLAAAVPALCWLLSPWGGRVARWITLLAVVALTLVLLGRPTDASLGSGDWSEHLFWASRPTTYWVSPPDTPLSWLFPQPPEEVPAREVVQWPAVVAAWTGVVASGASLAGALQGLLAHRRRRLAARRVKAL